MAKKDFTGMQTGRVYEELEAATSKSNQTDATEKEFLIRSAEMRTQGRQGCKAPRINMAFTMNNYEFIRVMARATGRTMTQFVNLVITAYRNEHPDILEQARSFLETVNSGIFSAEQEAQYNDEAGANADKE